MAVEKAKWMLLVSMFQYLHYAKLRKEEVKKGDFIFKFAKNKKIAEKVWVCFYEDQIEWPHQMYSKIF